jgi:putative aldouronate transport system substrate-binding protein
VARKEFLDKLKMDPPETAGELYEYLSRLKNELNVEIPFSSQNTRFTTVLTSGFLTSPFGLPRAATYQFEGKIHYGPYEPEFKDVLVYLNRLYREKLLDNNFAVTDEPTANANMLSGKSGLIATAASRVGSLTTAANSSDFTLIGLPSMSTAKGVKPLFSQADGLVATSFWCYFPEKCRDIENSLKLINYLHTEEGRILAAFGEENVTFTYVNNTPILTEFVTNNPKGLPLDGLLRVHGLLNFPVLQLDEMSRQRFALPQQIQAMTAWASSNVDKYRIFNGSMLAEYANENAMIWTDISTFVNESQAQFISGALPIESFDTYFIPTLKKLGVDRLLEIVQISYDAYNK